MTQNLFGCVCGPTSSIEEYDFVARVKIVGVLKSELYKPGLSIIPEPRFYEIKIEILELFKGEEQKSVIVHGGNRKYRMGVTSCDLNLAINEEWLVFGKAFKGKIAFGYCSLSRMHKNVNNEVDFKYNRSIALLDDLRLKFEQMSEPKNDEEIELKYLNEKTKLKEHYNDHGLLEGERIAYYANGQIMLEEYYANGLKNGELVWYYRDGKIHRISEFEDGKQICETYIYNYKGDLNKINFFDDNGVFITTDKK